MFRDISYAIVFLFLAGVACAAAMEPVSLNKVVAATGGRATGDFAPEVAIDDVATDSRKVRPGDLFWALCGERHDGHDFVGQAIDNGAVGCVVEREIQTGGRGSCIVVDDTLKALWRFANWYRKSCDALVIGVTGSFGKTTTREMIHATLSSQFSGIRSPKNFNNEIGLPLSLLAIETHHEFAVLEKGASRIGEIAELAAVSEPEIGVITGVGAAHLEGFGDEGSIVRAKGELIEQLPASGLAILNGDDARVRQMAERAACPVVMVGTNENNDVRATGITVVNRQIRFTAAGETYELAAAGRHHVSAALAAIAIGRHVGMTAEAIRTGLRSFVAAPGRCQVEVIGEQTIIDDTYNANPASTAAACRLLADWTTAGRKHLVLGDMLELGAASELHHRQIGRVAAEAGIDHLIAFGGESRNVVAGAIERGMSTHRVAQCSDLETVFLVLDCWLQPGDVVLVKGSRSTRMERVIDWLRQRHERPFQRACA